MSKLTVVFLGIGLITIIALSVFTFSEIRKMEGRKNLIVGSVDVPVEGEEKSDKKEEEIKEEEDLDEIEMIKKAFLEEGSARCTYYDEDLESESELYIKNGKVRSDDYYEEGKMVTVLNKEGMYMWAYDSPEEGGMKISIGDQEPEWAEMEDQFILDVELKCTYEDLDDSIFDIPENTEFVELSDTLMNLGPEDFFDSQ